MRSTNYRNISGLVVTLLLLALVALIAFTLLRTSGNEVAAPEISTPQATSTSVFADTGIGNPPTAVGLSANAPAEVPGEVTIEPAVEATTEQQQQESEAQIEPYSPAPTTSAESAVASGAPVTDSVSTTPAGPGISITIQPTPTRRSGDDTTDTASTPVIDPDTSPEAGVTIYANPNFVNGLAWAGKDLWLASAAGAQQWLEDEATPQTFGIEDGLSSELLRAVATCPLDEWSIVFASQVGLEVVDSEDNWRSVGTDEDLPFANLSAVACTDQILAVGSAVRGVALYDFDAEEWTQVAPPQGTLLQPVRDLAFAPNGALWVASGAEAAQIVDGEVEAIFDAENSPLTGEAIAAIGVAGDGALWLTTGDRLFRFLDDAWETYRANEIEGDYPQDPLRDLQPEEDGRVWLLSQSAEICRFDPELGSCVSWVSHDDGSTSPAVAFAVAADGNLAYATAGAGAQRMVANEWQQFYEPTPFPVTNRIFALASDTNGWLWAVTSSGAQRVNPAQPQQATLYTAQQGVSATNLRTLYADNFGGVWLGGIGAAHFDGETWTNFSASDGLASDAISAITQDSQSRVWFGTKSGLSIWTGSAFFNLTSENGLPDAEILSLAADAATVWIGSAKGGLYRFENNQLQVLTQENVGLPSNRITALLAMPNGTLYVGTDKGLVQFVRGEFVALRGIPAVPISALALSQSGDVVVGTTTRGTWRLAADAAEGAPFAQVQSDAGPLPTTVRSLAYDLFDAIWIGTDGAGVTRLVE